VPSPFKSPRAMTVPVRLLGRIDCIWYGNGGAIGVDWEGGLILSRLLTNIVLSN